MTVTFSGAVHDLDRDQPVLISTIDQVGTPP